ncbi:probable methyltransferase PMT24 [Phragmites australis]|uniref:probable methyltransferase PMT24 n=1 Tax=Phragmites australis TaxID=29695 RepID=UPI002D7A0DCE|nr:probable methyltransferase PMT24 [Phragmites australis]
MAGAGRSSRGGGKRGAASATASACVYYATTGLLVALCVAGAYFLTSTSAASADGDAVTAYRHTTRSSFAYEVTREKAPPSPPREVDADDAQAGKAGVESGADEEGALDDPHAKPDDRDHQHASDEVSSEEESKSSAAVAMKGERSEEGDHAAAGEANAEDTAATSAHGREEDKGQEAVREESHDPQEQEQQPQLQMPHEETRAAAVEEKSLDGGIEEESNAGQRQREEEQAAAGSLRLEVQEDPQTEGDERMEQHQPEEERGNDQPQSEEYGNTSMSDAVGEAFRNRDTDDGDGDKPAVSQRKEDVDGNASQGDHSVVDSLVGEARTEEQKAWSTQADQSHREKDRREDNAASNENDSNGAGEEHEWRVCNVKAGADYIPCLDNEKAIKKLRPENYRRYEHRERHCPDEGPTCLVALPSGYRRPVEWPKSRDRIWYSNVPHTKLVAVKGHQNWVKVSGRYLTFPGGGTQFIHGALHYIDFLQQSVRGIAWGKHTRVVLDVGCGVASFGGYLFERDVVTMSFAPKDEHEAQVQMALERGIPAISAVMGSKRLPFPSKAFDLVHCARCRVPWHADGGALLLELNRVLRPGGFFVWSATPVYQKLTEDVEIWKAMSALTKSMCWELVSIKKDRLNGVGVAFYHKPTSNECYETRRRRQPPMCSDDNDANAAWYIRLNSCMHRVPTGPSERGARWPAEWPRRVRTPPYWLNSSQAGVYGKPAPEDFTVDYEHWRRVVDRSYLNGLGVDWSTVRNVMDMRAAYGGFAAALRDKKIWVMNVVNVDAPDTLPIIFERGLFGIYHDWCESFSTYPRTYDLLHADHLFSKIKDRCAVMPVVVEVDRIVRPGGSIIVRDESSTIGEVEKHLRSLHWDVRLTLSKNEEGVLYAVKSDWRPELLEEPS